MKYFPKPIENLIAELEKLPSIGPKSAQRIAIYLVNQPKDSILKLSQTILKAKEDIVNCSVCFNLSNQDPCEICNNSMRDNTVICVVKDIKDLIALESTREYKGLYHVLGGLISPMDGIGPNDLKIKELLKRVSQEINEIIIALPPSIEGEATTLYLSKLLKPFNIKLTRIAFGLPIGGELEYADELTLVRALEGRREI